MSDVTKRIEELNKERKALYDKAAAAFKDDPTAYTKALMKAGSLKAEIYELQGLDAKDAYKDEDDLEKELLAKIGK